MTAKFIYAAALVPWLSSHVLAAEPEAPLPVASVDSTSATVVAPSRYPWPIARHAGNRKGAIISSFGVRKVVVKDVPVKEKHLGTDFYAPVGTPVHALRAGRVVFTGLSKDYPSRANKKELGRLIVIVHSDGSSARYVHIANVKVLPHDDVTEGTVLGGVASSDELTQSVLHLEWRNPAGKPLDLRPMLQES